LVWKRNVQFAKSLTPPLIIRKSFAVMLALKRLAKNSRYPRKPSSQFFVFLVNWLIGQFREGSNSFLAHAFSVKTVFAN